MIFCGISCCCFPYLCLHQNCLCQNCLFVCVKIVCLFVSKLSVFVCTVCQSQLTGALFFYIIFSRVANYITQVLLRPGASDLTGSFRYSDYKTYVYTMRYCRGRGERERGMDGGRGEREGHQIM